MTPLADDVVEQCPAMHGHAFPKDARGRTMRDNSGARAQTSQGPGPRNGENGPRTGDDTVTDRIDCCRDREMLPVAQERIITQHFTPPTQTHIT